MNTVATDYAWIMLKMERHNREMHDACLLKKWELARNHAKAIDVYVGMLMDWLDGMLMDWLDTQQEGLDGKFQEVRMPQQETV
jgi:hypothetical protein